MFKKNKIGIYKKGPILISNHDFSQKGSRVTCTKTNHKHSYFLTANNFFCNSEHIQWGVTQLGCLTEIVINQ